MREIKFRGKRVDNGEWVDGYYCGCPDCTKAIGIFDECGGNITAVDGSYGNVKIQKNTVGQFTGLKDKNGVDIYEGDIIEYRIFGRNNKFKLILGEVKWDCGFDHSEESVKNNPILLENPSFFNRRPSFWVKRITEIPKTYNSMNWSAFHNCRVIGNIHEVK